MAEHMANLVELVTKLPALRNPWSDFPRDKAYCSLYIFNILVELGVLDSRILSDIPFLNTEQSQLHLTGGSIFYPQFLIDPRFPLNHYTNNGWSYGNPVRVMIADSNVYPGN